MRKIQTKTKLDKKIQKKKEIDERNKDKDKDELRKYVIIFLILLVKF